MFLIILNILVWLGPFLISLKKGVINSLHPQFILPVFMVYFILNSYVQDLTNWMNEGERGIIVGVVKLISELDSKSFSFDYSLILLSVAGVFFHIGSRIFNQPIYKCFDEPRLLNKPLVIRGNKLLFLIFSIFMSSIVWLPNYLIPNAGHGTFWTFPLALSVCFVPVLLLNVNKFFFLISLFIAIFISFSVLKSKAALAFIFFPIIFYYCFFNLNVIKIFFFKKFLKNFLVFLTLSLIFISSLFLGNSYGKLDIRKIFHRDNSFEIFSILVESKRLDLIDTKESWIKSELLEIVPSVIYTNKSVNHINPSKRVALELFPETARERPFTYWNRHLLFAGYYDFGVYGVIFSSLFFGMFLSFLWRYTKKKVLIYHAKWPLFIYLPIPSFGVYFLSVGGFSYSLINTTITCIILYIIILSSRLRLR